MRMVPCSVNFEEVRVVSGVVCLGKGHLIVAKMGHRR